VDALAGIIVTSGSAADAYYPNAGDNDKSCPTVRSGRGGNILEVKSARTVSRFTVTGIVVGLLIGWLLSLVSGNFFVVLLIGSVGMLVGLILGFIHRNDP